MVLLSKVCLNSNGNPQMPTSKRPSTTSTGEEQLPGEHRRK
jgi:hypothetical protein